MSSALSAASHWLRDALRDPAEGRWATELKAAQAQVILSRVVVLIWISLVVMPTTIWSYTYLVAPEVLPQAIGIVLAACAAVVLHRYAIHRGAYDRDSHLAMLLLVAGIFGPTGALILELTHTAEVSFLFAFFLIYYAFMALFPANTKWMLATAGLLIAAHVGAVIAFRPHTFPDAQLLTNVIYLAQLSFIGLVLNRVVVTLFFAERRATLELETANEELKELDRAKTSFFSNVSHELRTPLTLVLAPLKQLLDTDDLPAEPRRQVRAAVGNANRLLKMVNLLLDFARIEAGQGKVVPTRMAMDDLVRSVTELFDAAATQQGLTLQLDLPSDRIEAIQDIDKIEQILVNLIGNAMKFTPSGGRITVACRRAGDRVLLSVADTGPGIPASDQEKIFQRFAQLENAQKASVRGTGIGLSMVREFARLLGGQVTLDSEVGVGSTFTVELPLRAPGARTPAPAPAPASAYDRELAVADLEERPIPTDERAIDQAGQGRPRVLIVDDNPALVSLVRSILEERYNLYLAYNGEEALERIAADPVDLVISDVMMPGMTGLELCQTIKQTPATRLLPVILLTAQGGQTHKVEGIAHGADDYLGKPFDPQELLARVHNLFEIRRITKQIEAKNAELEAAYAQLKDEEVKLVSSEKLRTMGELAAGVFHELHNYINMIHNGAVPLKELVALTVEGEPLEVEEVLELADLILEASDQARGVTSELKAYAYQGAEMERTLDLHEVVRSAIRMFGKLPRTIDLTLELPPDPLPIRGARTRLVQVFTNLVKNGMDAMQHQGKLEIVSGTRDTRAFIAVRDTGPGVPPALRDRIFEPFQSTKAQGIGLGLGLSMARKIVEEHGGELAYDATWTEGACFIVYLPHAQPDSAPAEAAEASA